MSKSAPTHSPLTKACSMLRALGYKVASSTEGAAQFDPEVLLEDGRRVQVCSGGAFIVWGPIVDGACSTTDCPDLASLLKALRPKA